MFDKQDFTGSGCQWVKAMNTLVIGCCKIGFKVYIHFYYECIIESSCSKASECNSDCGADCMLNDLDLNVEHCIKWL